MKTKKIKIAISALIIALIVIVTLLIVFNSNNTDLKSIKSKKELENIYYGKTSDSKNFLIKLMSIPLMALEDSDVFYSLYSMSHPKTIMPSRYYDLVDSSNLKGLDIGIAPNSLDAASTLSEERFFF